MRKQTRRSISISGPLIARVRAYCETSGISLSSFVEGVVAEHLGGGSTSESDSNAEDAAAPHEREEESPLGGHEDASQGEPVAVLQEVDLATAARQEVEHVEDEEPEEPVVEREPEIRVTPRRPAADPALRVRSTEPDPPELGGYIPPHLLF